MLSQSTNAARLVPVADHQAFSQAINDYLKVPADDRVIAAREVASKYRWDKVVRPVASKLISFNHSTEL